jgi:hypothetical protein
MIIIIIAGLIVNRRIYIDKCAHICICEYMKMYSHRTKANVELVGDVILIIGEISVYRYICTICTYMYEYILI